MKKDKQKDTRLKRPSLLRRVWKVWLYNIFWLTIFSLWFIGCYTVEELCLELDYFLLYGLSNVRQEFIVIGVSFWFFFRQSLKFANLIYYTVLTAKHDVDVVKYGGSKRIYEGVEGNGKTINMAYDLLLLACDQDEKMRLKYYLKYPFKEELTQDADWKVLTESFEYYEAHPDKIPHLMTNFYFEYQGRKPYDFTMDYIDQKKRIAEGFALGLTEIANILPNAWSKVPADESKDKHLLRVKNEFLSLSRQYTALKIVADEQRTGEVYLGFRSVISSNRKIDEREKVLSPHFLERILKRLERRVFKKKENTSKRLSNMYTKLENLIEDIGFYVFTYSDKEAIQDNVKKEGNIAVFSCDIPFDYDTRSERVKYRLYGSRPDAVVS